MAFEALRGNKRDAHTIKQLLIPALLPCVGGPFVHLPLRLEQNKRTCVFMGLPGEGPSSAITWGMQRTGQDQWALPLLPPTSLPLWAPDGLSWGAGWFTLNLTILPDF